MTIHAAVVLLALATISHPPSPARLVVLLAPVTHRLIVSHIAEPHSSPPATLRTEPPQPRFFHAPTFRNTSAQHSDLLQAPALEILPAAIPRTPLPPAEFPAAPPAPLRTDNLASLLASAAIPTMAIQPAGFIAASSASAPPTAIIRSSGFERIVSEPTPPEHARTRSPAAPLQAAGFADATTLAARAGEPSPVTLPVQPITRPVEILSKPQPAYTKEARHRRVEGEVLLKILFAASGQARVLAKIRGLGYGLDENAVVSAEAIRFRPAERAGIPADSTAVVHIVFQLAY